MPHHSFLPDIRLREEILSYQIAYSAALKQPYFPGSMIAFNVAGTSIRLDGEAYTESCLFCFSDKNNMKMMEKGEGEIILVVIRPGGLYRLFGYDGSELGGSVIRADAKNFPQMAAVADALEAAPTNLEAREAVLNRQFLALADSAEPYGIGEIFYFMSYYTKGQILVEEAAIRLGVSKRSLERECSKRFGRTPKTILRRFKHHFAYPETERDPRWENLDPFSLYADQAHFLRDAKHILGMTPLQIEKAYEELPDNWRYYLRGDFSKYYRMDDKRIRDERDGNRFYWPDADEWVKELGLQDWDDA